MKPPSGSMVTRSQISLRHVPTQARSRERLARVLDAADEVIYPDPGFPIYRSMIEFTGAQPVPNPVREENGFAFLADETLALITKQTRLLIINSPANPTGGVTPKAEIDKLVAGLAKWPDVALLSDEIYGQMTYDGLAHQTLLAYP